MRESNVYESLEAKFHEILWNELAPNTEAELILENISQTEEPWLEVGSGTGRILKPIQAAGQKVEGIEPSQEMVEISRNILPDSRHHVGCIEDFQGDKGAYGAVLFTAFVGSLLEDLDKAIKVASSLLKEGGVLMMTQLVPWAELSGESPEGKWYVDQRVPANEELTETLELRTRHQIFRHSQLLIREHKYVVTDKKGKKVASDHCKQNLRWYYYKELMQKLIQAGFQIEKTVWDLTQEKMDEEASVFTIFAKK